MPVKIREAIKRLEADGWKRQPGKATGHRQYKHPTKPGKVTVAGKESDDLDPKTWNSIQQQAGWR
jgi:predicted RNA binding protein YcfA (HicA-like mRNA interferase family)